MSAATTHGSGPAWVVVDAETTGLSPREHRIVELAVVVLDERGSPLGEASTLVDPGGDLGSVEAHGIRPEHLAGAPRFGSIAGWLQQWLAGKVVVGHNLLFTTAFLDEEYRRVGVAMPHVPVICTMTHAPRYLPSLPGRTLEQCCAAAGIPLPPERSALNRARAAAALFARFLNHRETVPSPWVDNLAKARKLAWPPTRVRDFPLVNRPAAAKPTPAPAAGKATVSGTPSVAAAPVSGTASVAAAAGSVSAKASVRVAQPRRSAATDDPAAAGYPMAAQPAPADQRAATATTAEGPLNADGPAASGQAAGNGPRVVASSQGDLDASQAAPKPKPSPRPRPRPSPRPRPAARATTEPADAAAKKPAERATTELADGAAEKPIPRANTAPADEAGEKSAEPDELAEMVDNAPRQPGESDTVATYLGALDTAVSDRNLSFTEAIHLKDLAAALAIFEAEQAEAHRTYLRTLASTAWTDHQLTETERDDLLTVGRLLEVPEHEVDEAIADTMPRRPGRSNAGFASIGNTAAGSASVAGAQGPAVAAWYPDPYGESRLRWWDGTVWTSHLHD